MQRITTFFSVLFLVSIVALFTACGQLVITDQFGIVIGTIELDQEVDYSGIAITINGQSFKVTSNISGSFRIEDIPVGTYSLTASKLGYDDVTTLNITVIANQTVDIGTIVLFPTPPGPGAIEGTLQLTGRNSHIGIKVIDLGGQETDVFTNISGNFAMSDVPTGTYNLEFRKWGFITRVSLNVAIEADTTTNIGTIILNAATMDWQNLNIGAISSSHYDMIVGPNGTDIYIAYYTPSGTQYHVMKYDGTWSTPVDFPGVSSTNRPSLRFDSNDVLYLAMNRGADIVINKSTDGGTNWEGLGAATTVNSATLPELATDTLGSVYLAYKMGSSATVKKLNTGTPAWDTLSGLTISGQDLSISPAIASLIEVHTQVTSQGIIYLADKRVDGGLSVRKYDGGWTSLVSPGTSTTAGSSFSLALDSNEDLYIAYPDVSNDVIVRKYTIAGNTWTQVGPTISGRTAENAHLILDAFDVPYIAYTYGGSDFTMVSQLDGNSWIDLTGPSDYTSGGFPGFAIKNTGAPAFSHAGAGLTVWESIYDTN